MQFPLGWVSDRMDRRYVIATATVAAATAAAVLAGGGNDITAQYVWAMVLGGFFIPLYSLCLARANDEVGDNSLLSTAGTILMLFALGSIPGPIISGLLMSLFSPAAFFCLASGDAFCPFFIHRVADYSPPANANAQRKLSSCPRHHGLTGVTKT